MKDPQDSTCDQTSSALSTCQLAGVIKGDVLAQNRFINQLFGLAHEALTRGNSLVSL
jgi:hypothetical protein